MIMRWEYVLLVLGLSLCLIGAIVMFEGNIFGENNSGLAIVIGIVGVALVAASDVGLRKPKKS